MREFFSLEIIRESFYLAGGTGLALHCNHRKSFDIDLFSEKEFDLEKIQREIILRKGTILDARTSTIHGLVNDIKVSFFHYPYSLVCPIVQKETVAVASIEDIGCMKAVAISQRAEKKDFFDMVEILKTIAPERLKTFFLEKYGEKRINCYHILRSFFFFEDAESSPDPISLNGTTWSEVKGWFLTNEKTLTSALLC
jgi:hypothetical protein